MTEDVNSARKWEADYARQTDGWDLGGPTPVFEHLLSTRQLPPGRMIVLGAGRGHDARLFARHGFQVTAVDFASQAVQEMHRLADPAAPVEILQQDIFTLPETLVHSFDYVLEYTCFCAIDPARRAEYADLVTRLLKPNGLYIDLAFRFVCESGIQIIVARKTCGISLTAQAYGGVIHLPKVVLKQSW
jgi:SAM-dependent methyltransferase